MSIEVRTAAVLALIDDANARDPEREDGEPRALRYGRRMSAVLAGLVPDASPHLRIACRGQHIERWTRPRRDWPEGKAGYLRWREDLKRFHAARVADLMEAAGWDAADRERVGRLIQKQGIKRDAEVQALEDTACLVFITYEFADFAAGHPADKIIDIVAKPGRKMSPAGRRAALALGLPAPLAEALMRAETEAAQSSGTR
jgi:hypothetical protein